jgi:hypothetical protein
MSTKENRFHRACANVEDHLNYTKFSYFPPRELVDGEPQREAKTALGAILAQFNRQAGTGVCGKNHKLIAMFPLDCE